MRKASRLLVRGTAAAPIGPRLVRIARNRCPTGAVVPLAGAAVGEGVDMTVEAMVATVLAEVEDMAPMTRVSLPRRQNDDPSVAGRTESSRRL